MKILGYSERGIINSLIFNIGDDKELMDAFISLINIPEIEKLKDTAKDYTILLEQSFSRFGDADLVIIIHYEKSEDNKVLFIEGKVKTSKSSWIIETQFKKYTDYKEVEKEKKPKDYWSVLFSQLYLKKMLIDNWTKINDANKKGEEFVIETSSLGERKIGTNEVVLKAFKLIECSQAFYIGLIPTIQDEINQFLVTNEFTEKMDYDINFLSWEKVHEFCKNEEQLKKVVEIFDYNEGQIYKY